MLHFTIACLLLVVVPFGLSHPEGEKVHLHAAQPLYRETLSHCQSVFEEPEFVRRTITRRQNELQKIRSKRGLEHRLETLSRDKMARANILIF
jgi:hypothetical protein